MVRIPFRQATCPDDLELVANNFLALVKTEKAIYNCDCVSKINKIEV